MILDVQIFVAAISQPLQQSKLPKRTERIYFETYMAETLGKCIPVAVILVCTTARCGPF